MTGCLTTKTTSSGKEYYYVLLRYKDPKTSKWRSKYVKTGLLTKNNKKKANELVEKYKKEYAYLEREFYYVDEEPNICWYLDHWLNDKKSVTRASTIDGYSYRVNKLKEYFENLGDPYIYDISSRDIKSLFCYMLKEGKENKYTGNKTGMSVRSVRSYKSILTSVFDLAIVENVIQSNPVPRVKVGSKPSRSYGEEYLFLSDSEVSEFLKFVSERHNEFFGIVFFGIFYGLRRSEILGLKWDAIDFDKKVISIKHTVVRVKNVYRLDSTKTCSSRRDLVLFREALKCLTLVKEKEEYNKQFFGASYKNNEGYVFCWDDGRQYSPDYITKKFKKIATEFGRPEITLHKLRHTCASMLISKGWDVKRVQHWLGHEDIQTTLDIYAHYVKRNDNMEGNDLNEIALNKISGFC